MTCNEMDIERLQQSYDIRTGLCGEGIGKLETAVRRLGRTTGILDVHSHENRTSRRNIGQIRFQPLHFIRRKTLTVILNIAEDAFGRSGVAEDCIIHHNIVNITDIE